MFLWLEAWGREGVRVRRWIVGRVIEEAFREVEADEITRATLERIGIWSFGRACISAERWIKETEDMESIECDKACEKGLIKKAVTYAMNACADIQCSSTRMAAKDLEMVIKLLVEAKGEIIISEIKNKAKEIIKEIIKKETVRNGIECRVLLYLLYEYNPYYTYDVGPEIDKYIKYGIPKSEAVGWFLMGASPEDVVYSYVNGRV